MFSKLLQEWLQTDEGKKSVDDGRRGWCVVDFAAWLDKNAAQQVNDAGVLESFQALCEQYPRENAVALWQMAGGKFEQAS